MAVPSPTPHGGICMQALCSQVFKDNPPRRMVNVGLDFRRFDQVLAVLIKHGRLKLYDQDVRANVLGGVPAVEPAVDAAIAAAIVSSFSEAQLPADTAFIGEVDLGGALPQCKLHQCKPPLVPCPLCRRLCCYLHLSHAWGAHGTYTRLRRGTYRHWGRPALPEVAVLCLCVCVLCYARLGVSNHLNRVR